jgi:hypothetical protein
VAAERAPQPRAVGGQVAGEQRVVLREPGARAEGLLPDGRPEALGEVDERHPRLRAVGPRAHDEDGRGRVCEQRGELLDGGRIRGGRAEHAGGRRELGLLPRRREPVVHRDDHDRRAAARDGLVVGAGDRARHTLRRRGQVRPDRVVAGEPFEATGEKRLERQVATVLLPDDHDERRPVHARGRERRDGVAQARRRVDEDERGAARADGEPGRHADHGPLVQGEHEPQVAGQPGEERDLGRARVGEDGRQAALAEHLERRVAHRARGRALR